MLPDLTRDAFQRQLKSAGAPALSPAAFEALHTHYEELRRWSPKVDLIGPGAEAEIFERHYVESLAVLPWLPAEPFRQVDLGSGAGFPGFVLAAVRPDAETWLVEPRERRAAFLSSAARKAGLSLKVLAARVDPHATNALPDRIQVTTLRALRLDRPLLRALTPHLAPGASVLVWAGGAEPEIPAGFEPGRSLLLGGSRERNLREYRWTGNRAGGPEGSVP